MRYKVILHKALVFGEPLYYWCIDTKTNLILSNNQTGIKIPNSKLCWHNKFIGGGFDTEHRLRAWVERNNVPHILKELNTFIIKGAL